MKISRKGFISSVTAAMAVAALPERPVLASLSSAGPDGASAARFRHLVGSGFELALPDGGRETMVLTRVDELRSCRRTEQFSLAFTSTRPLALAEGNYRVRHNALGTMDLFMKPGAGAIMRADFGLLRA